MRRTLTIASIIIVLLGVGVFVYFRFFFGSAGVIVAPNGSTTSLPVAGQTGSSSTGSTSDGTSSGTSPGAPTVVSSRLVQISTGPISLGEAVVDTTVGTASTNPVVAVDYIERGSGNVFSYSPSTRMITRINNKTIPGIQSASWLPDASAVFVRYLSGVDFSTINTYSLAASSTNGFFLPQNLSSIDVSQGGVLSVVSGVNGSNISLSNLDGTHTKTLFTTPLTSIRVSFAGKNQYLVFSKPTATLSGDVFLVDSVGNFSRIAGPLPGLVALASPSGKWVLISYTQRSSLYTSLINTLTGATIPLPVATIVDKCVWTTTESSIYCGIPATPDTSYIYPDDWYQGAVAFSDRIWKIDVAGRYAKLVLDFSQANKGTLDAEALAIDPLETTLVFVNKTDGSLWSYSL